MKEALGPPSRLLSIICQGRNDGYMGNFLWRLSTALNRHARNIRILGVEDQVEVIVTDWGSETPLWKALSLSDDARALVRFLMVPPALAKQCDSDSTYSGVHPTNAGARRARGTYTLFSDSDVYIPLESMALLLHSLRRGDIGGLRLHETFFWGSKWHVPYDLVQSSPKEVELENYIATEWSTFRLEKIAKEDFIGGGVCLLMPRGTWWESRGWDERLIYWGWYDIDWHRRLTMRQSWDLLEEHQIKIFHLEHYSARFRHGARDRENKMKANPQRVPDVYAPNPLDWGLAAYPLEFVDGFGRSARSAPAQFAARAVRSVARTPRFYSVRDAAADERSEEYQTADITTAVPPIDPLFVEAVRLMEARSICLLTRNLCGAALAPFAQMPSLEKIYLIDEWRSDTFSDEARRSVPQRIQNAPYATFLIDVEALGLGERVHVVRAHHRIARDLLRGLATPPDALLIESPSPYSDNRLSQMQLFELLSSTPTIVASGPDLTHVDRATSSQLDALCKAKSAFFLELAGSWGAIPLSILPSAQDAIRKAIHAADARLAAKLEQLSSDTTHIYEFLEDKKSDALEGISPDLRVAIQDGQTFHSPKRFMR